MPQAVLERAEAWGSSATRPAPLPVRVGQVGLGYWGANLLRNLALSDQVHLVAICDAAPEALETAGERYPAAETMPSMDDLLARDDIEAVVIATPCAHHYRHALAALQAGKHVFVEKPMTRSVEEAAILVRVAAQANRCLMVGHTFRYNNVVTDIKGRIDRGELGDVLYMYGQRLNLGRLRPDVDVVWTLAPHDISIANFWFGARPHQVSARGIVCVNKGSGLAEVSFAQFDYADGRTAHFHMSWLDPRKCRQMVVVGSEKMLIYDDVDMDRHIQIFDKRIELDYDDPSADHASFKALSRAGDIVIPNIRMEEPLAVELGHFVDCVRSGDQPLTDGRNGAEVVAVIEALSQSMKNDGAVVPVPYPGF